MLGELTAAGANSVERETGDALAHAARALGGAGVPSEVVAELEALARQVGEPCVVAVVGQVKAGKSSFINALLEDDKAVVGTTETTATINHFTYGKPDPERPVRCHWRNGQVTAETEEFLQSLQGNDVETLRRAEGIDHLEHVLPNSILQRVTLVDTPGTGAAVAEHESRTADFIELNTRLRERHDAETRQIRAAADAVIYLVGQIARASDQELLERFGEATGADARASNAVGVIAKIDLSDELMARRDQLAAKIGEQLSGSLSSVVAVSAGLARAVDRLREAADGTAATLTRSFAGMPTDQLDLLLADEALFTDYELDGCAVPPAERRQLRAAVGGPWRVFVTLVRTAAETGGEPDALLARAEELAGFDKLRGTLRAQFLERGHILRCFRIARDARRVLNRVRFEHLPAARSRAERDRGRLDRFLAFVAGASGDDAVRAELDAFVREQLDVADAAGLEEAWQEVDGVLSGLLVTLGEHAADFHALQELERLPDEFSANERDELRALLGLYGADAATRMRGEATAAQCIARQLEWRRVASRTKHGSCRQAVAERAHDRLGLLIAELEPEPVAAGSTG